MYGLTRSTPDRCTNYVTCPNHAALIRRGCGAYDGYAVYHFGTRGPRFIGTVINGALIKP